MFSMHENLSREMESLGSKTETTKDQMEVLELKNSWVDITEERVSDLKSMNINYPREKKERWGKWTKPQRSVRW